MIINNAIAPHEGLLQLHSDHTLIRHAQFPGIGMKFLLPKLTARLKEYRGRAEQLPTSHYSLEVPREADDKISHSYFWPRVGKFFKEKDVIVTETGNHA